MEATITVEAKEITTKIKQKIIAGPMDAVHKKSHNVKPPTNDTIQMAPSKVLREEAISNSTGSTPPEWMGLHIIIN